MHLTNVAIQKTAENYDNRTGGKMELQALKFYLMSIHGVDRVDALFWEMQMIVIKSLLAVQQVRGPVTELRLCVFSVHIFCLCVGYD